MLCSILPAEFRLLTEINKQQICNARKASDHAAPVILCHPGLPGRGSNGASSCVLVSSQDQQYVI